MPVRSNIMSKKHKETFGKIIYFDEQAAVDLIELEKDGMESIVIKKLKETAAQVEGQATGSTGFFNLAKLKLSGNASHQKNNIIETQIASTLISSFMEVIHSNQQIIKLDKPKLVITQDSFAYFRNLAPILHMIEDIKKLKTISEEDKDNFSGINIRGIETTLDSLSGYYDFLCTCNDGEKKIARFNIAGLRNNYNLNDLTKMDLKLYGIKVGESLDTNLEFTHQIDTITNQGTVRKTGLDRSEEHTSEL